MARLSGILPPPEPPPRRLSKRLRKVRDRCQAAAQRPPKPWVTETPGLHGREWWEPLCEIVPLSPEPSRCIDVLCARLEFIDSMFGRD